MVDPTPAEELALKITSVETFPVSLPLAKPVHMSHVTIHASNNVLVKVTTDEGIVGWGEGVEAMDVTGDNQGRIKASIDALGARIVGMDPMARTRIWAMLRSAVYGNTTGIAALDIALHDLAGKALGVPVCDLIGGRNRTQVPALTLMGSGSTTADVETFAARYAAGFRWFKLKLAIGNPADEATTLRRMAETGPEAVLCGDANAGWSEQTSARFLAGLDGAGVRFIEQPTRSDAALVRLAERSPVAICADESAKTFDDILGFGGTAVAGVSLKLIKHVGITGVMRAAAICDANGLAVNLAGKIAESSIAAAANLHCAAAMTDTFYGCSPANQGLASDITQNPPLPIDGVFTVPSTPGLGVEVDEEMLRRLLTE
jgi:L-alanine-DL-glutamate epimerase-like enolase superfamily enzyme